MQSFITQNVSRTVSLPDGKSANTVKQKNTIDILIPEKVCNIFDLV